MIKIFSDLEELNLFAAQKFIEIAIEAIEKRGCFTAALAGGSTPKSLYRLISGENFKNKIDWRKAFFFFGDERNVLPMDAESNFRTANENLFEPLKIKKENIFRWQTELKDAEEIAADYEKKVKRFFEPTPGQPADADCSDNVRFDLILLGMGADGHTASLFPFTKAVRTACVSGLSDIADKIAVANLVEKLKTTRLTLTFPTINNARHIIFLVAGAEKSETLREVLEGEFTPEKLPAQNIRPTNGNLFWLLDENVAKLLRNYGN